MASVCGCGRRARALVFSSFSLRARSLTRSGSKSDCPAYLPTDPATDTETDGAYSQRIAAHPRVHYNKPRPPLPWPHPASWL